MNRRFLLAAIAGLALVLSIQGVTQAQGRSWYLPMEGRGGYDGPAGYEHGWPSDSLYYAPRYYAPPVQVYQPPPIVQQPAMIKVEAPDAAAKVFIDGRATTSTGTSRLYITPPFPSSTVYTYRLKVTWMEGGHEYSLNQVVATHPGETSVVDFTDAATAIRSAVQRAIVNSQPKGNGGATGQ